MIRKPQGYDFVYFDWDRTKVTCLRNNEPDTFTVPTLRELINSLDKPNAASVKREFTKAFPLINDSVMWAIAFAAGASDSRFSFEGLLGSHAHGAKSMLRSQFYHWGWAGNGKGPMNRGASLTDYRRQARQLGSLVDKHTIEL